MSVERVKRVLLPADQRLVLHTIEQILREQALYRQTSINPDTATVTTIITEIEARMPPCFNRGMKGLHLLAVPFLVWYTL